jgi:hypothetical protein
LRKRGHGNSILYTFELTLWLRQVMSCLALSVARLQQSLEVDSRKDTPSTPATVKMVPSMEDDQNSSIDMLGSQAV